MSFVYTCVICKEPTEEVGYCLHENGLVHHLACSLTPEMEKELLNKKD